MKDKILLVLLFFFSFNTYAYDENTILMYDSYYINVDIEKTKLDFYGYLQGEKILIETYTVSTVKKNLPHPKGQGNAYKVEINPWWYPTDLSIKTFVEKGIYLQKAVPPGDKNNYMGTFKIYLDHKVKGKGEVFRIHGTLSPQTIGSRETGGCVRMDNNIGEKFAKIIKTELDSGKKVIVNFS